MKSIFFLLFFSIWISSCSSQIISKQSSWKYLPYDSIQDSCWRNPTFDDNKWAHSSDFISGNFENNNSTTFYFRKTFKIKNPKKQKGLRFQILRNDGAIIYINGHEMIRSNMPNGNITYTSTASMESDENNSKHYFTYIVPSNFLKSGKNTIAVEVHKSKESKSKMRFDLQLDFSFLSSFIKAPYLLFSNDDTKMLLLWQLNESKTCTIYWGTDTNFYENSQISSEYGNSHLHKMMLSSLKPNTKYYYKVSIDSSATKKGSFYSNTSANVKKISFYAYGDTRTNPAEHNLIAKKIMEEIAHDILSQTFIVSSGDFVSNGNNESDWDSQFFDPQYLYLQKMLANLPYCSALGNHEGQGILYAKYFPYPMFTNGRFYYSFDNGAVHFSIIDQFTDYSIGSCQYNWLLNDLASSNKAWKFILLHEPGWTAGGHSNNLKVQNIIQPLCLKHGVQFVITGHNHYYARASVNGVMHITTGGGGAPLYNPKASSDSIIVSEKSYHFCKFNIDNDTLKFTAERQDGTIIENIEYHINSSTNFKKQDDLLEANFKVFSDEKNIHIVNKSLSNSILEIFDENGLSLIKMNSNKPEELIPNYNKGFYFVRISVADKSIVKKILLE